MKNFVQVGANISLIATAAAVSGQLVVIGGLAGIASGTAAIGETVTLVRVGVFNGVVKKTSETWSEGDKLYWTGTELTKTVSTNRLVGVAVLAATSDATTGTVFLDGVVR